MFVDPKLTIQIQNETFDSKTSLQTPNEYARPSDNQGSKFRLWLKNWDLCSKLKISIKNDHFGSKRAVLAKNQSFVSKIAILTKNSICLINGHFGSKLGILAQNWNFVSKNLVSKLGILAQNWNFVSSFANFSEKRQIGLKMIRRRVNQPKWLITFSIVLKMSFFGIA